MVVVGIVEQVTQKLKDSRSQAVDILYSELDALLLDDKLDAANIVLCDISRSDLPLVFILSASVVSFPWSGELTEARNELIRKARQLAFLDGG